MFPEKQIIDAFTIFNSAPRINHVLADRALKKFYYEAPFEYNSPNDHKYSYSNKKYSKKKSRKSIK
jgi:hypothetical protein